MFAATCARKNIRWAVFRGVADHGTMAKRNKLQSVAAFHAALAARSFLKTAFALLLSRYFRRGDLPARLFIQLRLESSGENGAGAMGDGAGAMGDRRSRVAPSRSLVTSIVEPRTHEGRRNPTKGLFRRSQPR